MTAVEDHAAVSRPSLRAVQRVVGATAVVAAVVAVHRHWWPFDANPAPLSTYKDPSVWQYLLSDRITLGAVRGALALFALYVAMSVPALFVAARWAKGFGSSGLSADEAETADATIKNLETRLDDSNRRLREVTDVAKDALQREKRFRETLSAVVRGASSAQTRPANVRMMSEEGNDDDSGRSEQGEAGPSGDSEEPSG